MAERGYVTVVSGLPRTGTSMMMRVLEAGGVPPLIDGERVADEDNPRGYYEFEPVKKTKADPSWVAEAPGKAVKLVHLLLMDLPGGYEYRVVFMRRKMEQILASQKVMLERQGKKGAALSGDQLAKIYQGQLDKVDAWLGGQGHFSVLKVDYNQMVGEPGVAIEQIDAFLGGGLDTGAMAGVVEPDLYRQRG